MPTERRLAFLPAQDVLRGKTNQNLIRQLHRAEIDGEVEIEVDAEGEPIAPLLVSHAAGHTLIVNRASARQQGATEILFAPEGSILDDIKDFRSGKLKANWVRPKPVKPDTKSVQEWQAHCDAVRESWLDRFNFRPERWLDGQVIEAGLRPPQIGALYAILAHWTVSEQPATIVMPTGTGKTETMLALLVSQRLPRLLVIVPTSPLREQIAGKFITLGLLKQFGIVESEAQYPVVGVLTHKPRTPQEVEEIFLRCNVIVTTMNIAGGCTRPVQQRIVELSSHLFIDEAHHIAARTWDDFRRCFNAKPIVQFTATPFRTDGKNVDGKVVFNYPLRKAQSEGYFKPIEFRPVNEFSPERADREIAVTALDKLNADLQAGYDHIVMARASSISRAEALLGIYQGAAGTQRVLLIHSQVAEEDRQEALRQLRARDARVVICVDMLGEGFDLPALKIAALHDMHKSLAITLQFTGRFTRTSASIGNATVVANIADPKVGESLRDLYAEDADWNAILRQLSEGATGRQVRRTEFIDGFTEVPDEIPLQNIFPKMSAVVYRTMCQNWRPDRAWRGTGSAKLYAGPTVNSAAKVLLFVTRETEHVPWGAVKDIQNTVWHLYLVHWNPAQNLLFINSSNNSSRHEDLAKALAGDDTTLIRGENIFRSLYGINRLMLMNLGLSHSISRAVRFSMHVGSDIKPALSEAHLANKIKSNLFGKGFEKGTNATIGCSQKGRVWSYKIAYDMSEWVEWCHHVGAKLIDTSISTTTIFENVISPELIAARPALVPLAIEWPDEFWERGEEMIHLDFGNGHVVPFFEVELALTEHERTGPIRFSIQSEGRQANFEIRFQDQDVEYAAIGTATVDVQIGRKKRPLSAWFEEVYPIVRFEDGAFLIYNELFKPPASAQRIPFDRERIMGWDWTGINLRKESQTSAKHADSIQRRVIEQVTTPASNLGYDIVFDDDDSGEAADIIALKIVEEVLHIHFYHCKFSKESTAGARVDDLYAVCGQAQRSVHWKSDIQGLIQHMRRRDDARRQRTGVSRFEHGDLSRLQEISRKTPRYSTEFKVFVVQPGLSKAAATNSQLELLAVTELYLKETFLIDIGVIASP